MTTLDCDLLPVEINAYYINRGATFAVENNTTNREATRLMMSVPISAMNCDDAGEYTCYMQYVTNCI